MFGTTRAGEEIGEMRSRAGLSPLLWRNRRSTAMAAPFDSCPCSRRMHLTPNRWWSWSTAARPRPRAAAVAARAAGAATERLTDPTGCGGLWLRARSGPVRDAFLGPMAAMPLPLRRIGAAMAPVADGALDIDPGVFAPVGIIVSHVFPPSLCQGTVPPSRCGLRIPAGPAAGGGALASCCTERSPRRG